MLGSNKTHLSTNTYGTISYMAPELLTEGKLSKQADVYSFGILSARIFRSLNPVNPKAADLHTFGFLTKRSRLAVTQCSRSLRRMEWGRVAL